MAGLGRSNSLSINTSGSSLFGNASNSNTSQGQQSAGLFGSSTNASQPQSTSLFGNLNKPATTSGTGGGLFGSSTAQSQPQQTGSLFGGALGGAPQTQTQTSQSGGLFGGGDAQKPSPFGASTAQASTPSLFGNTTNNTQQNQPATSSLFGSTQQAQPHQQQSNTMFGNLQGQNKSFGLGSTNTGFPSANAVQIQAAESIKGTTRFNDLSPEFQAQIVQIEEMMQNRINTAHKTRGTLPAHVETVATIAPDVAYVEKLLSIIELGLDNDSANIAHIKAQVKKDAEDASLSFRAIENQSLPPQFRYGNASLTSSTAKPSPTTALDDDDPTKPVDLLSYFNRRTDGLGVTLELYQRQIREIEAHLRTMEAGTLEKAQQLTGSRSSSRDQRQQLIDALGAIERAILQSAGKVGKVRDEVNKQIIGNVGAGLL
ncbi:hypothetical protein P280DRAFT_465391 [Massarina eburnea CBS 473.64]|uniref:Nucleoporin Nup54 alpha-helical domain-containing protein n=1 Tax=Massarina eburnea CBS 473.64 TaxID=1395130 RepID=A0A6A6SCT5_9PLEO|nr:hypothetical protein P280DRAFT_465391 [Massarina eburnea CBS 473.64]